MKNIIAFAIIIFLVSFFVPQNSFACSYIAQAPEQWYVSSDVVFIGEIKDLNQVGDINGSREVDFEILQDYKGGLNGDVMLTTGANSAMCGYDEGSLSMGDIWVIFANDTESFNNVPANRKFDTLADAQVYVDDLIEKARDNELSGEEEDPIEDEGPTMCTMQYDPVCGQKDTGIQCVTTPCSSTEIKTYGNNCMLTADKAEFLYAGECKEGSAVEPVTVTPTTTTTTTQNTTDTTGEGDVADQDSDGDTIVDGEESAENTDDKKGNPITRFFGEIWNFIKSLFI